MRGKAQAQPDILTGNIFLNALFAKGCGEFGGGLLGQNMGWGHCVAE